MAVPTESCPAATSTEGFLLDNRWQVLPDLNRIIDGEVEHQVADKFMQVLMVLAENRRVVSRQELFDTVWPDTLVVDESLTRAISSLRKLFEDDPKAPRIIETIPKKGYRLVADVEKLEACASARSAPAPQPKKRSMTGLQALVVAALLISTAAVVVYFSANNRRDQPQPTQLRITSLPGIEEYPTLSPAGDRCAFVWDGNHEEPDGVFVQVIGTEAPMRLTETIGHYAFPAWSHDSRHIAYARLTGDSPGLFMVPATGGAEIELVRSDGALLQTPAFSPDGRWLCFAQKDVETNLWHLKRMELGTGVVETIAPSSTVPFAGFRPRFSPDGERLAFLRFDGERFDIVITSDKAIANRTVDIGDRALSDFDWAPDGDGFVICSGDGVHLIGFDGSTRRVLATSRSAGSISSARTRSIVTFSEGRRQKSIRRWTPVIEPGAEAAFTRILHSTAWDAFPALSPDRDHLAFLSDRSGKTQLWLATPDGEHSRRLTDLDHVLWSSPAWSPDSQHLVFTAVIESIPRSCVVNIANGRTRFLSPIPGGENRAGWSHDAGWLYVSRSTSEGQEIWKRTASESGGDSPVRITSGGGSRAIEAPDRQRLFFTRNRASGIRIWSCALNGGQPELVLEMDFGQLLSWTVAQDAIVFGFRADRDDSTYRIARYDLQNGRTTELFSFTSRLTLGIDIDHTDGSIYFDQTDSLESDIVAIDHF